MSRTDDLVRRKDVIDALHGLAHRFEDPEDWCILEGEAEFVVSKLPSAEPETSADIQIILDYLDNVLHPLVSPDHWEAYSMLHDMVSVLQPAQSEIIRCKDCKCWDTSGYCIDFMTQDDGGFCAWAERREV